MFKDGGLGLGCGAGGLGLQGEKVDQTSAAMSVRCRKHDVRLLRWRRGQPQGGTRDAVVLPYSGTAGTWYGGTVCCSVHGSCAPHMSLNQEVEPLQPPRAPPGKEAAYYAISRPLEQKVILTALLLVICSDRASDRSCASLDTWSRGLMGEGLSAAGVGAWSSAGATADACRPMITL